MRSRRFRDRTEAGQMLAASLAEYAHDPDVIVLGLPRGGVVVAFEVAKALDVPLDVFVVRKLGVPGHEELAMGAIASGGLRVVNPRVVTELRISDEVIDKVAERELEELERREREYRDDLPPPQLEGRTVIVVDDGLATGSTMRAAVATVYGQRPRRVVVAVPTAARQVSDQLTLEVDEVVCVANPEPFYAVGQWYDNFSQTTDEEVRDLLARSRKA